MSDQHDTKCSLPPSGWECTRGAGHEGPCAAIPSLSNVEDRYVAWLQFKDGRIRVANSDDDNAFKVYRWAVVGYALDRLAQAEHRAAKAEAERDELREEARLRDNHDLAVIDQRDDAIEAADRLAYAIGTIEDIGEHTNCNNPWEQAHILLLDKLEAFAAEKFRADRLEAALSGVCRLFEEPSHFYIKKLGAPITNADQDVIDKAFIAAREALLGKRKRLAIKLIE